MTSPIDRDRDSNRTNSKLALAWFGMFGGPLIAFIGWAMVSDLGAGVPDNRGIVLILIGAVMAVVGLVSFINIKV
ncbi:MAG: hypothetical protein GC159_18330 [Phycisphaera sp.]|nr:hypothetical protein [Phycisphaera sp.]